jgi:hypothetical protein
MEAERRASDAAGSGRLHANVRLAPGVEPSLENSPSSGSPEHAQSLPDTAP